MMILLNEMRNGDSSRVEYNSILPRSICSLLQTSISLIGSFEGCAGPILRSSKVFRSAIFQANKQP